MTLSTCFSVSRGEVHSRAEREHGECDQRDHEENHTTKALFPPRFISEILFRHGFLRKVPGRSRGHRAVSGGGIGPVRVAPNDSVQADDRERAERYRGRNKGGTEKLDGGIGERSAGASCLERSLPVLLSRLVEFHHVDLLEPVDLLHLLGRDLLHGIETVPRLRSFSVTDQIVPAVHAVSFPP